MTTSRYGWGVVAAGALITWIAMGALLALASRVDSLVQFQAVDGVLIGVAAGSPMVPLMSTVTLWFDRHRALAVLLPRGRASGPAPA